MKNEIKMSDTETFHVKDIEQAMNHLSELCRDVKKFNMSIPPQRFDTDMLFDRVFRYARNCSEINCIKLLPGLMCKVENGAKKATTRLGLKSKYKLGPVFFQNSEIESDKLFIGAEILRIEAVAFCDLTEEMARLENYKSLKAFREALVEIYGQIDDYATLTVIEWDI